MDARDVEKLLEEVKGGKLEIDEALNRLRILPYEDLGFARIDTHRTLRKGFPEVVLCQGKTHGQIRKIVDAIVAKGGDLLTTRASKEVYQAIKEDHPEAVYYEEARMIAIGIKPKRLSKGTILIVTGGTSDIPVAEEAAVTAQSMGNRVEKLYDVGVAGIHRLFGDKAKLLGANVIICVAGMEGALPSVIGGLVSKPVIAVPTSCGYGASFKGLSALLGMLNSCAPGVAVVNIDNGFGAGYVAGLINQMGEV